jgi:enolase-phosphatase E1
VLPAWQKWRAAGLRLGIYSSGSVPAQKLLFGYTKHGDVTANLSAYFDLDIGSKRETASYQKIAVQLELPPTEILFLSDIEAELSAAQSAGLQVVHVVRPGTVPSEKFQTVSSFLEI